LNTQPKIDPAELIRNDRLGGWKKFARWDVFYLSPFESFGRHSERMNTNKEIEKIPLSCFEAIPQDQALSEKEAARTKTLEKLKSEDTKVYHTMQE